MNENWTATSFADVADLREWNRCKRAGMTEEQCLEHGDNGIGAWGMSTVAGTGPCVALPAPYNFHTGRVIVHHNDKSVTCEIRDRAPSGIIDMNPDCCEALGLKPPVKVKVNWEII